MATGKITFSSLTIPTPEPYDKQSPTKQQENYYYVMNQILAQMKANGETKDINPSSSQTVNVDLTDLIAAVQDLAFTGEKIELPALGLRLEKIGKTLSLTSL